MCRRRANKRCWQRSRPRDHQCFHTLALLHAGRAHRVRREGCAGHAGSGVVSVVKKYDTSRPVTAALAGVVMSNEVGYPEALDVVGYNYLEFRYPEDHKKYPDRVIYGSENGMNLNAWNAVAENDFISAQYLWTGIDYLGEARAWPSRSNGAGLLDLAGFPKDVYYMYQSEWSAKPVLHIFPHWNWKPGQLVDVWAYYNNADEVELFLNGKSLGIRRKNDSTLHVMWRVPFKAGTLKAVSRKNGKIILIKEIKTAGEAARIELAVDKTNLRSGEKDLSFVTARILDKKGNLVPYADDLIKFSITGNGIIAGTDNGYQADTVSLKSQERKCWKGLSLAIIQSTEKKGNITLTATSPGISSATITIRNN